MRRLALLLGALVLLIPASANAAVYLELDRAGAHLGDRVLANGCCTGLEVFFVPEALAPGLEIRTSPPDDPRFVFVGILRGDPGDTGRSTLRFRVPAVRPGFYRLVVYCDPCVEGPEASLISASARLTVLPALRAEAMVKSVHPEAILDPRRNWTYLGDTVRVSFRDAALPKGQTHTYRSCYQRGGRVACRTRTLRGSAWDSWRLRVAGPWVPCRTRGVRFWWIVDGRTVAARRIWVYECV